MVRTRVGYAGGQKASPTYRSIGDHTETIQIDFDPNLISYEQLLDIFWNSHDPTRSSRPGQYMRAVFYQNEQQRELAMASKAALERKIGSTVRTEIVPVRSFTMAEDYHQKYTLKGHKGLKKELMNIYPRHQDLVDSTAAARINGYVGGYGSRDQLSTELEILGLSDEAEKLLVEMVRR
ncbi:MAG: peptide-methionine (S)-S-oxide reductase [Desulfofustis sp.]|nr:peptide-methionine (S)-S-oxide reductase [Desulfofustis sp.]MBT8353120.1 peptide-methionine (S)-S-oxide reductase [Desulfofustis sp.]